jgi:hypothetical protein
VQVGLSRCQPQVRALLATYGLLQLVGDDHVFDTDRDAVAAFDRDGRGRDAIDPPASR